MGCGMDVFAVQLILLRLADLAQIAGQHSGRPSKLRTSGVKGVKRFFFGASWWKSIF
jgi:hypothetical protein